MKIAIISDVHADVHALNDALRSIERLGCDQILCAGDLVDYGIYAERRVMRRSTAGAVVFAR